jgi:hypothetical protein
MVAWVTDQCGVATSTARQWVASAQALETLPVLSSALASGSLSLDKVAPLAEVASPETDAELTKASTDWSVQQVRELATWHKANEEALARSAGREFEHRTLRFNDTRRTMWVAFTRDEYAFVKSSLVNLVARHDAAGVTAEVASATAASAKAESPHGYIAYDQRLYDVLIDMFRSTSEEGMSSREPGRSRRSIRPRVVLHAPIELLLGVGNGVAEVEGVGPVAIEVARRLACDAQVTLSIESADGAVLDQGRAHREPTVAQRTEIARRDKGCRFPGCTYTEFTDIHHIQHWTRGGRTDLDNLITLCSRHHNAVHELGWTMGGDANVRVSFTSPTGQEMASVPSPTWRRRKGSEKSGNPETHKVLRN